MLNLTKEQLRLQSQARELAQAHFAPKAAEVDRTEAYPWDSVALLRDSGLMMMAVPKSHGGLDASYQDMVVVIEEIAKTCGTMGRIITDAVTGTIAMVKQYGSAEQLDLVVEMLRSGDKPAICITEPQSGSAATEMLTRADRDGDHYVLNGDKYWITGGGVSRLHVIYARVFDDGVEQGIGAFICVRDDGNSKNLIVGDRIFAMGIRGIPETHLHMRDLRIHKSMLLQTPGGLRRSFASLMRAYNAQRIGAGTVALGIAQGAFEEAVERVSTRHQFGRPLAEFQGLQWMIADMSIQLEAARLMLYGAAGSGEDLPDMHRAAQAKVFAAETSFKVCNDALQMYGSSGYGRDMPMERHVRDVRMFTISGGTAQILRNQVASVVLGRKLPQTRTGYAELAQKVAETA